ncbi:hypothetical protein [Corynebacterium flavescens]|uniref:hypothetical protein n=1 Tax=Corynebacterium flavescens TaxID=28028 RepID=UPI0028962EE0|nr:hypothetical protein [Corynebacterium flavescens]
MKCAWCDGPVESSGSRGRTSRFCSGRCRTAACRHRKRLPDELDRTTRWIRWADRDGAKVPVNARGHAIDAHKPSNWRPVEDVSQSPRRGFVLAGDGIVCIDIDHCLDSSGNPKPWTRALLRRFPSTWTEVSPSGDGLHVWGLVDTPSAAGPCLRSFRGHRIEIYADKRFITITGRPLPRCPITLANLQEAIDTLN